MSNVFEVIIVAGGLVVSAALIGLGLGWGFVAGIRAAGGLPHRVRWDGEVKSVMRHYTSDGSEMATFDTIQ